VLSLQEDGLARQVKVVNKILQWTVTMDYGSHAFSVAAPTLWNSLPADITNAA